MVEVNKQSILQVSKNLMTFQKIYNSLCRKCQQGLFKQIAGITNENTQSKVNLVDVYLKEKLCKTCTLRIKKFMEG